MLLARFLRTIDSLLDVAQPTSLLDVGCGEGVVTELLARRTSGRVVGVDLGDERMRGEWARRQGGRLDFLPASAYDLPFDDRSFECVCALEVLEHLERPHDALAEMVRVSARWLLVSVPREPLWRAAHLLAGRHVRALGNTPGHVNHWSARGVERLVGAYADLMEVARPFPWTVVLASRRAA